MTSDSPGADPTRPAAAPGSNTDADAAEGEDWWDGTVDLAPPPAERPAEDPAEDPAAEPVDGATGVDGMATAGDGAGPGGGDGGDGSSAGRPPRLLGAAVVVLVAGAGALGAGLLASRDDDGSPTAAEVTGDGQGYPGGQGGPGGFGGFSGFGPGTSGTITELDPGAATLLVELANSNDTVEVSTTDDTTISETVEGTAGDIEVGDDVLVVGEAGDDGTVAAAQVVAGDPGLMAGEGPFGGGGVPSGDDLPQLPEGGFPGGAPPDDGGDGGDGSGGPGGPGGRPGGGGFVTGTVESVDDGSLTVQTADETVTVTVSSDTTVLRSRELSFDDLASGDEVAVLGTAGDDDVVVAATIRRGEAGFSFGGAFPGDGDNGNDRGSDGGAAGGTT